MRPSLSLENGNNPEEQKFFYATQIPVQWLFDYLDRGNTISQFRQDFPEISEVALISVILEEIFSLKIKHTVQLPESTGEYWDTNTLNLSNYTKSYFKKYDCRIYKHQYLSIKLFNSANNICIATSTNSGKSDIFFACAIELLSKSVDARILAIYPLKALSNQQSQRWQQAFKLSGINVNVGRIDGSISRDERYKVIQDRDIRVIVCTPDILHAWILSNLHEPDVQNFLKKCKLIILDEIHTYRGVFGSNSAFLYRRINHAILTLSGYLPQYITASATIKNPHEHFENLTGLTCNIIDSSFDTSPKRSIDILMVESFNQKETLNKTISVIKFFAKETDYKTITFLDSRKMVEQVASIANRNTENNNSHENHDTIDPFIEHGLSNASILPYRSGYESHDAEAIQKALIQGNLNGVVCTSALEMGIDIKELDIGILFGVPNSATSFYQRIGRVGRHNQGIVIILNDGSVRSNTVFRQPDDILNMPYIESALYMDNEYIQYINALCFASQDQEYDKISQKDDFVTHIKFPDNFIERCKDERNGIVPQNLLHLKTQIDGSPQLTYPLRDLEPQFKVECKNGKYIDNLGTLSFSQVMREAYPHAVYYYMTYAYRVKNVSIKNRKISVAPVKSYYSTKPVNAPTLIYPNLKSGNIYFAMRFDQLLLLETNLQIAEYIVGIRTKDGHKDLVIEYPINFGIEQYNSKKFGRNIFTSGTIISHPILSQEGVQISLIAELLFEVFLTIIGFEPQDVNFSTDKFRVEAIGIKPGSRFLCIYDQTYGSLRLTERLTDFTILQKVFDKMLKLIDFKKMNTIDNDKNFTNESLNAIRLLRLCLDEIGQAVSLNEENTIRFTGNNRKEIILPYQKCLGINGTNNIEISKGYSIVRDEEFYVVRIQIIATESNSLKLAYLGYYEPSLQLDAKGNVTISNNNPLTQIDSSNIRPIPGISSCAIYDLDLQEIVL